MLSVWIETPDDGGAFLIGFFSSQRKYRTNRKIEEIEYNNNSNQNNKNKDELNETNLLLLFLLQLYSSSCNKRYCVSIDNKMLALTHNVK